jgi:hypothetical protein
MISAIQSAGMDLIVKNSLMLITEAGFVNKQNALRFRAQRQ